MAFSKDRRKRVIEILAGGFACITVGSVVLKQCSMSRRVDQYERAKHTLDARFETEERFRHVRVMVSSSKPSMTIYAPNDLSPAAKADLENLVHASISSPVSIYYTHDQFK
jgi:hypothetical protein